MKMKKLVCWFGLDKDVCYPYYSFSIPTKCEETMLKSVKKFDESEKELWKDLYLEV